MAIEDSLMSISFWWMSRPIILYASGTWHVGLSLSILLWKTGDVAVNEFDQLLALDLYFLIKLLNGQ